MDPRNLHRGRERTTRERERSMGRRLMGEGKGGR